MTHVVRVDDDVWDLVKARARPLEDTFNSVLKRLFRELAELRQVQSSNSAARGALVIEPGPLVGPIGGRRTEYGRKHTGFPEREFEIPILKALQSLGGSGRMAAVLDRVKRLVEHKLTQSELEALPSDGLPRWSKKAQWARFNMIRKGLLKSDSSWGVWELTEAGRRYLEQAQDGQTKTMRDTVQKRGGLL